jgi:hypothetical protein
MIKVAQASKQEKVAGEWAKFWIRGDAVGELECLQAWAARRAF